MKLKITVGTGKISRTFTSVKAAKKYADRIAKPGKSTAIKVA